MWSEKRLRRKGFKKGEKNHFFRLWIRLELFATIQRDHSLEHLAIWLNLGLLKTSTDLERNSNSPKFIFKEDNLAKQLQLVGQGAEFKFLSL